MMKTLKKTLAGANRFRVALSVDLKWEQGNTNLELVSFRVHACAFFLREKWEMKDILLSAADISIFYCTVCQSPAIRSLFFIPFVSV